MADSASNNSSEFYRMGNKADRNKKRGRCVILNYKNFIDKTKTRNGTEHDVAALKDTFEDLNFEVIVHQDMTKKGTAFIIRNESQFDHSEYFAFVLCILSHGERGRFLCIDSQGIDYDHLFTQFNGENCRTLAGKPKLFFIQACQGDEHDWGTSLNVDSSTVLATDSILRIKPNNPKTRPITGDQLAFFCSYSNYYSMRDTKSGSWFIQDLCEVLKSYAGKDDLLSMIQTVQRKVSEREASIEYNVDSSDGAQMVQEMPIKQMPRFESTLIRKVYL